MPEDLGRLKFVSSADVYKAGVLAGRLNRTSRGSVVFSYTPAYLSAAGRSVATTLPVVAETVEAPSGALPSFYSGLLPEGHRLTVLKDAVKTSLGDELSLLLAVGADVPGDVQIVPDGETPAEPLPLADTSRPEDLDFAALAEIVDRHGLPGVQAKASERTTPVTRLWWSGLPYCHVWMWRPENFDALCRLRSGHRPVGFRGPNHGAHPQ